MEIPIIMNTLAWIGFCQSLFAAILMFTKKESSLPDKILSAWLTLLAIDFLSCGLDYEIFGHPLLSSSFLLFNPALFFYVRSLTLPNFKLLWVQLLHLLPFLFFKVYAYIVNETFSVDSFFVQDENFLFRMFFSAANILSWLVYNPLSIILIIKHQRYLRSELSNIERNENLGWLLTLSVFYFSYCVIAVIVSIFAFTNHLNSLTLHIYNYSTLLLLIYSLSFYGLRQKIVSKKMLIDEHLQPYKNSYLSKEIKRQIQQKIINYFENDKAYLNADLNMNVLSEDLKIPKYQITEVLNTEIGMNFFHLVNSYRVEAVKMTLADPKNKFSIEAIGYDCGFSSKSAFYTVFKNLTGVTPISYRNKTIQ